jgi:hypothetical protein
MELVFNLVWLAMAAGALLAYAGVSPKAGRQFELGMGALLCVLTLLLPAISITDDLHFDAFAVEDSNATKRLMHASLEGSPISHIAWFGISLLAFSFAALRRPRWRGTESAVVSLPDSPRYRSISSRPPPFFLAW